MAIPSVERGEQCVEIYLLIEPNVSDRGDWRTFSGVVPTFGDHEYNAQENEIRRVDGKLSCKVSPRTVKVSQKNVQRRSMQRPQD